MTTNLAKVEAACHELTATRQPITFASVARRTGLGRTTLYRNPALRAVVEGHRRGSATSLTRLSEDLTTLTTTVALLADKVRHHEEQLRALHTGTTSR